MSIKHYCGILGLFGVPNAARLTALGLYALQHRGEEGAGIVSVDDNGEFHQYKDMGQVAHAFAGDVLDKLKGQIASGHNRYSTTGGTGLHNVQPLVIGCKLGTLALSHNGNLVNTDRLRLELTDAGAVFQTTTDSELMLHSIARSDGSLVEAVKVMMTRVSGAYSLVIMTQNELVGVRDPHGFRPLCIGKIGDGHVLASETCALDMIEATFIREVLPGEIVHISGDGIRTEMFQHQIQPSFCVFEYVYITRPDSLLGGVRVYISRFKMGQYLYEERPCEADIVVPIPDSGNAAADGFAKASGIPICNAYVRNHYGGRSFLQPNQALRKAAVKMKLSLIPELVKGKRVVIVDDSVVRGTTCQGRVEGLREAGAREVHVRASCPPHRHPCYYGVDFPTRGELIAVTHPGNDELQKALGVDSIGYLSEAGLRRAVGHEGLCMACFNGRYPIPLNGK